MSACAALLACGALRSREPQSPAASAQRGETQQECARLRTEIRDNQQAGRQAPSSSTAPEIVAAAQAKADRNVDELRQDYANLDCPADSEPPLLTAPPAPPPPGSPRY